MVFWQKRWLVCLFVVFLVVDIVLLVWLKLISPSSKLEYKSGKPAKETQKAEIGFFKPFKNSENTRFVLPGYFSKNDEGGAITIGILESITQKGNKIVANFRFGNERQSPRMDFVVGLIKPKTKLHFYRSKIQDLFPVSENTLYQQIEPEEITSVLHSYINQPFRLSLKEPYSEDEILKQGVKKEIVELIKILNSYFDCNQRLIETNNQEVLKELVDCQPAVFDLLTYDANL